MQAMNGSGGLGVRRLYRLVGCVAAVLALSAMTVPSIAGAAKAKQTYLALGDSLAFGYQQHIFNEKLTSGDLPQEFKGGYAEDYYGLLSPTTQKTTTYVNDGCPGETSASLIGNGPELAAVQASVPAATGEAPCAYHNVAGLKLHNEYGGTKSQLESAIETIKNGPKVMKITLDIGANDQLHLISRLEAEISAEITHKVVDLAGAEGERAVRAKLEEEAEADIVAYLKDEVPLPPTNVIPYFTSGEEAIASATGKAYAKAACEFIGEGIYGPGSGPFVWEPVCASPYSLPGHPAVKTVEEAQLLGYTQSTPTIKHEYVVIGAVFESLYSEANKAELEAIGEAAGNLFAYNYLKDNKAKLEAEGGAKLVEDLNLNAPLLDQQIERNVTGIVIALRKAGYKGMVTFVGTYDAYGNDYGTGELLPTSNALTEGLNGAEATGFAKRPVKACYVDLHSLFNTENGPEEVGHMETWTNMANFSETEIKGVDGAVVTEGSAEITGIAVPALLSAGDKVTGTGIPPGTKVVSVTGKTAILSNAIEAGTNGFEAITIYKANGPDIHPTLLGSVEIAKDIKSSCAF
jgi:hypothetical protein